MALSIIKQDGRRYSEAFETSKLRDSVLAACLSVRSPEGEAESVADSVVECVGLWCETKPSVTSSDIRRVASKHLARLHPDAAYLYQNHHLVV